MPPEQLVEEDYASSEDSDFAPDDAAPDADLSGASDDSDADGPAAPAPTPATRKRRPDAADGDADGDFENSGDEAIIRRGKKKRRKKTAAGGGDHADEDDEDEGGEGGLVKTRSMRAVEKEGRRAAAAAAAAAASGPVTIDVDRLWAQMTAGPAARPGPSTRTTTAQDEPADGTAAAAAAAPSHGDAKGGRSKPGPPEMIKIRRSYNFAGKVHTEEKTVARDSAEARLYLQSRRAAGEGHEVETADDGVEGETGQQQKKKPPRRAFRSRFEPALEPAARRADLDLGVAVRLRAREWAADPGARKVNVVEKSRMDWAGFVDKEGIQDELALAGRAKGSYAERQDFLARVEAKRDEDARRVRLAGRA